ncbi:tRNA lysidine(34) synthetase TilS [Aurantimonas sp. MSK8Z-1]|uniref:tRNA lysidine(34) synthetase TilS n=1 Tax=Mangrovibrevibacter kandeliae TaxID=2968473 RepID=UPI0021177068|nr:tRNA lysidine(34) synthetase TilS [Aurantimonas sp. MSK8Z-1]MCW4116916.1 tRNA lysidine(34) synthetase TilS [Aurantimonas sp. MSK8Z-1]
MLAVSGGPDSLALMLAAAHHRAAQSDAPDVCFLVVTVDHGLRPDAAVEAQAVARLAGSLGLAHETRHWYPVPPVTNLQAQAREARYALLAAAARDAGACAVMTAHHLDDQVETHLIAAARKAGDRGLAGMREIRDLEPGIALLRPLLAVPGARLKAGVAAAGLSAADDPSNRDRRFLRVRLREALAREDVDRPAFFAAIATHTAARDAFDRRLAASRHTADGPLFDVDAEGVIRMRRSAFARLPPALRLAWLARAVVAAGGGLHAPARPALERLDARLEREREAAATLGGAAIGADAGAIRFTREWGRRGIAAMAVDTGTRQTVFDRRFDVDLASSPARGLCLAPFGITGRGNPHERTLPVLRAPDGALLAVPPGLRGKVDAVLPVLTIRQRIGWRLLRDLF